MVTTAEAVELIARETGWKESDIRNRARWLVRDGYLPMGKPGRRGGADLTPEHLALLLLSLACPLGKVSSRFVQQFAELKTTDGDRDWTLMEALLDRVDAFRDDQRFPKQEYRLDRVMLLFKEDWPLAEIDFVKRDEASLGRGFPSVRLVFAKGSESDAPRTGLAEMLPAVAINGGVIMLISDLLEVQDG